MSKFHDQKEEQRKKIVYKLSNADIERIKLEATKAGVEKAFKAFLGIGCAVLHNSYGFGKNRCETFVDRSLEMFKRIECENGYSLKEIEKIGLKYGGVKL